MRPTLLASGVGDALARKLLSQTGGMLKGALIGEGLRFAIVVAEFHRVITQRLLLGAVDALHRCGVVAADIEVFWTPGAFEIPQVAKRILRLPRSRPFDAIVCLGAVIRGQTPHFDYVCSEAARGISAVALESGIPLAFGVLTTHTMKQALARAGGKVGNKGWDAAMAAVEMANLFARLGKA